MQGLDDEYDRRKSKPTLTKKTSDTKKEKKSAAATPKAPLTLDGPIAYRDQTKKKTKAPAVVKPPSPSGSSDEEDEEEMIYDEDEAW